MKDHLSVLVGQRGPGTKLSDLACEAIHQVYFQNYPVQEITALKAAESPKKSFKL
jgi:hypothetical protein